MFKKCFTCSYKLPLFMFSVDRRPYKREHDKGKVKCCRICNYKRWSKLREDWFVNVETNKFELVKFNSKLDILKRVLR
jgi:hypothetical protein